MGYAQGSKALGICDRCGFEVKLNSLTKQPVEGRLTELKVCRSCLDIDNPQWMVRNLDLSDNQALFEPRPDRPVSLPGPPLVWGTELDPLTWGNFANIQWGPQ